MDNANKSVVSMLASDKKITLFTTTGEVIDMVVGGPYDTAKIVEYLTPKLTGKTAVSIDLNNFFAVSSALNLKELAEAGIHMKHTVNGKVVEGIFFPLVSTIEVTVGPDKVIIPHVENLHAHMARAAADKSPSVANFFTRLAGIIQARRHSGEDLMKFIKKSEMPLTNDGRIIAYKRVTSSTDGYVVDSHTRNIKQRIGSRVTMPVDMVDPSRHNSCSTGLHVANLGYLGGFHGDKTMIVLVDPENFIAVPSGEDTKARVCSYDIIGVMSANSHATVNRGTHVNGDMDFEQLIAAAVEGRLPPPFEEIFVGDRKITEVKPLDLKAKPKSNTPVVKSTGKSLSEDKIAVVSSTVAISEIRKTKEEAANADTLGIPKGIYDAFVMLKDGATKADVARAFSTSTRSVGRWLEKHSYDLFLSKFEEQSKLVVEPNPEADEVGQEALEATAEMTPAIIETLAQQPHEPEEDKAKPATIPEQARMLFKAGAYAKLWEFKKSKKKSWDSLGFSVTEENHILDNKPK